MIPAFLKLSRQDFPITPQGVNYAFLIVSWMCSGCGQVAWAWVCIAGQLLCLLWAMTH